ncbi:Bis(5'-adenosyl)-triphosphatase ENPP4 [Halotydeus destructor]|nr:Bis(5'-adenosyl)-triphosphatase ENPP4 [Halotydeus destructor]
MFELAESGVFGQHMKSTFGTKTFPNHMSMATGLYQESHGIVHNHMYDPLFNTTFQWSNTESRWWDNNVSFPIWLANQQENDGKLRSSGGMMWAGTDVVIRNQLPRHFLKYNHSADWNQSVSTVISWLLDKDAPANLVMMYFDQPDFVGHLHGPNSIEYRQQVQRADEIIGSFVKRLQQLQLFEETNLMIVSDHGMSEIKPDRVIILDKFLNKSLYDLHGASPLWTILPKTGKEDEVYDILAINAKHEHFSVYKKESVPEKYHYQHNRRILPIVIVAEDGYDLVDSYDTLGEEKHNPMWGNHGYDNAVDSMRPMFIAKGPAFQEKLNYSGHFENIDLYPLMCYVLQLLPLSRFPSNGTISRISPILRPVSRHSPDAANLLPVIVVVTVGFLVVCLSATCFVTIAGRSLPNKSVEIRWDPGVTEFDFPDNQVVSKLRTNRRINEEAVLLLEDDDEEL